MIRKALYAAALVALAGVSPPNAKAAPIIFSFDNTAYGNLYNSGTTPGSDSSVQSYMQAAFSVQGGVGSVTVTGAGALSDNKYTGDGHVVGPVSGSTITPLTLGSTNGGVQHTITSAHDNYIVNSPSSNTTIGVEFQNPVYWVSFDYEIFPDGTCPDPLSTNPSVNKGCTSTASGNWPDFTFLADGTLMFTTDAAVPSGTLTHSTNSGKGANELAPQYLGTFTYTFAAGVRDLQFVDWPARIGIDDLAVTTCCQLLPPQRDVPEPGSLALIGVACAGLAAVRRRRTV